PPPIIYTHSHALILPCLKSLRITHNKNSATHCFRRWSAQSVNTRPTCRRPSRHRSPALWASRHSRRRQGSFGLRPSRLRNTAPAPGEPAVRNRRPCPGASLEHLLSTTALTPP